jgi:hypothetical protein
MPILNMNYWANKWWANIGEPSDLSVTATSDSATITWTDGDDLNTIPPSTFFKSILVRKVGSAPTSPSDWTTVVTETVKNTYSSNGYTDTWLTEWTTYYYKVFSYSDLGGISYCDAVSVTPQGWWEPWANTIAYYPLNWDVLDYSGNSRNMSARTGSISYWTLTSWDKYWIFDWNTIVTTANMTSVNEGTLIMWLYYNNWASDWVPFVMNFDQNGSDTYRYFPLYDDWQGRYCLYFSGWPVATAPWYWQWFMFTIVQSWWTLTYYKDGAYVNDYSSSGFVNLSWTNQWCIWWLARWTQYYNKMNGYVSNIIIEDKVRTAQEISKYYDQTKANYGL